MIDIQLPDGRVIEIDTDDPQAAAAAGKKVWEREQAEAGLNASEMRVPIMDPTQPDGQLDWHEQAATSDKAPPLPELEFGGDPARGLQIGSQGVGRMAADIAGAPVDLATFVMNLAPAALEGASNVFLEDQDEISLPRLTNPVGGSEHIRALAGGAFESAGGDLIDESEMGVTERGAYNINRIGAEAIPAIGGLQRVNRIAKTGGALEKYTQPFANPTARDVVTDTAAGAGAGFGLTAAQEVFPDNPIADLVAMLVFGQGGGRAAQVAQAPEMATRGVLKEFSDPDVPGATRKEADAMAEYVQREAERGGGNRFEAAERVRERAETARLEGEPPPTTGTASDNAGVVAVERAARARDPVDFTVRDEQLKEAAQDKVTNLRDPNADPRAAQRFVEGEADVKRQEAQAPVEAARQELAETQTTGTQRLTEAETARNQELRAREEQIEQKREQRVAAEESEVELGEGVRAEREGTAGPASERLDKAVVDDTLRPLQRQQREKYEAIDPEGTVERSAEPLLNAARQVRGNVPKGIPESEVLPEKWLKQIESLADPETGAPGTISFKDLNEMRPYLSKAITSAQRRGDIAHADALRTIKKVLDDEAATLAAEGGEAGVRAQEAVRFTKEEIGPRFGQGEGGRLRKDLNADDPARSATPPTATGGRFLKPGPGGKEAAADLRRIREGSGSAAEIDQASRDYVLADLAKVVGADGKIKPHSLRTWKANRKDMFESFPEIEEEVNGLLQDVMNRRGETGALRKDLMDYIAETRDVARNTKSQIAEIKANNKLSEQQKQQQIAALERKAADVERDIQKDAAAVLLNRDPEKAAAKVFAGDDPQTQMAAITKKLSKDREAAAGWKRAVTDHLVERVTGTNTALTGGAAEGPVSVAALQKFFNKHSKTLGPPNGPFSAKEMNDLRRAHKILEPMGNLERKALAGSQTAEKLDARKQQWNALETGVLFSTGNAITTGMVMKRIRSVVGLFPNQDRALDELRKRIMLDPELGAHLLERNVKKIEAPIWNSKLTRLLGYGEAVRETIDEDEPSE